MRLHALISLSLIVAPATGFAPWRSPSPVVLFKPSSARSSEAPSYGQRARDDDDDDGGDELDLEGMTREELETLMDEAGGPPLDARASLGEARDAILRFLGDAQEERLGFAAPAPASFKGPSSTFSIMEGGFSTAELGLTVMAGPSTVCDGLGLFISLDEDTESVVVPKGSVICGYSRLGTYEGTWDGDKSVGFGFGDSETAVIFDKKLMPLREALNGGPEPRELAGHVVSCQGSESCTVDCVERVVFVPTPTEADERMFTPAEIGVYCNDLAFSPGATKAAYLELAEELNVLELVWRLAPSEGDTSRLEPTWPIVITARDVLFDNTEPREAGLSYGFGYWKAKQR